MIKTIFFPGWAMPPDAKLARQLLPEKLSPITVCDYGFFAGSGAFSFSDTDPEIAKFANTDYELAIGYSLGSQFALRMALAGEARKLKALVIISGFAKFAGSHDNPEGQKRSGIKAMLAGMRIHPSKVLREFYRLTVGSAKSAMNSDSYIPNPSVMIEGLNYLLDCDLSECVGEINIPTLIIAGEDDILVKASLSRKLSAAIPNSKFIIIPNAGHSIPFANTEQIREIIDEFMCEKNII
jgi:pimeloyl-ACP methyl ester carboxylesterase